MNLKPIFRLHKLFNNFLVYPNLKVGSKMLVRAEGIDDLIKKTIEDVLSDVFGEKVFKSMLHFMETTYSFKWENVSRFSEIFDNALRDIFGEGSTIIEGLILRKLYFQLKLELKWRKNYKFSDYIKELRRNVKRPRDVQRV